jgi:hypothetical protein
MGIFKRAPKAPPTDNEWLGAGEDKARIQRSSYFGSPETMRAGGEKSIAKGDVACGFFMIAKAIEIAEIMDGPNGPKVRGLALDEELFRRYMEVAREIRHHHPEADLAEIGGNENGYYTVRSMYTITGNRRWLGQPVDDLVWLTDQVVAVTGVTVESKWRR